MAVKLRLRRMGKIRQPVYKVVAADARSPRDGKFIEAIGLYNPKTNPSQIEINEERAMYWLSVGAQPTETVRKLLKSSGVLFKRRLMKSGFSLEEANAKVEAWKKDKNAKIEALNTQKAEEEAKKEAAAKKAEEKAAKDAAKAEDKVVESAAAEDNGAASENADADNSES